MNKRYAGVAERAGHRCEYCHARRPSSTCRSRSNTAPRSRGAPDDESNLALSCRSGNLFKSDQETGIDETTREVVPLFHPRRDRWDEHFRVEPEDGALQGLTPEGRVTVACLRMNRAVHREARRSWMRLKLYP